MTNDTIEKFDRGWPTTGEGGFQAIVSDKTQDSIALQMEEWEFDPSHGAATRSNDLPVTEKAKRQLWREPYLRCSYVAALYKVKDCE